jgi:hypothetical protein
MEMSMMQASNAALASSTALAVSHSLRAISKEARSATCSVPAYDYSFFPSSFVLLSLLNRFAKSNKMSSSDGSGFGSGGGRGTCGRSWRRWWVGENECILSTSVCVLSRAPLMVFIAEDIMGNGGNRRKTAVGKWWEGAVVHIYVAAWEDGTVTRCLASLHLGKCFLH